jgi:4-carboxymuconolactone decarboxylase
MRFPPIAPQELTAEQRPLYDDMKAGINAKYNLFTTMRADGAIMGPWNARLHEPEVGAAIWSTTKAMTRFAVVSDRVRQIAILVVGTRFDARYELYAHAAVASKHGLSDQFISTLVSGNRPGGMADDEGLTSPRVRILVAPLESVNPGGDDEKANWQNTDKHSRTERLRGCCRRRARRWKTLRVRLA